jgi:GntR family transcriptional regulator
MRIELDPLSPVPIYQQIRDRTVEATASGALRPGDQLASVRQLAVACGINVATVAKAYDTLRQEGVIRTNHKSGSVIARGPESGPVEPGFEEAWLPRLTTLLAEGATQGLTDADILASASAVLERFRAARATAGTETETRENDPR